MLDVQKVLYLVIAGISEKQNLRNRSKSKTNAIEIEGPKPPNELESLTAQLNELQNQVKQPTEFELNAVNPFSGNQHAPRRPFHLSSVPSKKSTDGRLIKSLRLTLASSKVMHFFVL